MAFWADRFFAPGFWASGFWSGVAAKVGGGLSRSKRPVWVEENGKILVFRTAHDAAIYLENKRFNVTTSGARAKKKPVPYEVIDIPALDKYASRLSEVMPDMPSVYTAYAERDISLLLKLMQKVREWQDEEDSIILLLAA